MDVEKITAEEFLEIASRAQINGADKLIFRKLYEDLKRFPKTRQRLAFEFLALTSQALQRGFGPGFEMIMGVKWGCESVEPDRRSEYIDGIEKIFIQLVKTIGTIGNINYDMPLRMTAGSLRRMDFNRFERLLESFKGECCNPETDRRFRVLTEILNPKDSAISKDDLEQAQAEFVKKWSDSGSWN